MVDSQSIALIHLAISTPILLIVEITIVFKSELFKELKNGEIKVFKVRPKFDRGWTVMIYGSFVYFVGLTMRIKGIGPSGENHQVKSPPKYLGLLAKSNLKSQPKQPMCSNWPSWRTPFSSAFCWRTPQEETKLPN